MPELLKVILSAAGVLSILGFLIGILLALASKIFFVNEDKRKVSIMECLPGANCGECGYADCSAFADAVLRGEAAVKLCSVGVDPNITEKKVARVRCSGSFELAHSKYQYQGIADCTAAAKLLDGYLQCRFGCLGLGSCVSACKHGAIRVENGVAIIDHNLCNGCGDCVSICPKHIIDLVSLNAKYVVSCSSLDKGEKTTKACLTGCVGCKICEKNCPRYAIQVSDNLARIDYDKCISCGLCAENCPANIIRSVQ